MIRHKDYLLVQVPEGAKNWVHNNTLHSRMDNGQVNRSRKPLPPGTWQLIGLASELTEEQWREIVEWYEDSDDTSYDPMYNVNTRFNVFNDYVTGDHLDTAKESGFSLLRSHNLNANQTVILKLIQP